MATHSNVAKIRHVSPLGVRRRRCQASGALNDIVVRRLDFTEAEQHLDALANVLRDCVLGGASVNYMAPFTQESARDAFSGFLDGIPSGARILLAAFMGDTLVGTVQLVPAPQPNQPHRAEVAKLLVHRSARGHGVAQRLMERVEGEARASGKTLLVLDTVTGGVAERLYARLGWTRLGVIPNYALYPDGRFCDTTVFYKELSGV